MLRSLQRQLMHRSSPVSSCITAQNHLWSPRLSNESLVFGQPTAESHPHILQPGEVTPGIALKEYQSRRMQLLQALSSYSQKQFQTNRLVAIIPSATKVYMTEKIPYPFRQNSDFLYLTGFMEPDTILVLASTGGDVTSQKSILFVPKRDLHAELWDGPRTNADTAVPLLGVDEAYNNEDLPNILNLLLAGKNTGQPTQVLWCDFSAITHLPHYERVLRNCVKDYSPKAVESPRVFIHQLRVIKSPAESTLMSRSCEIASEAFIQTISATKAGVSEHEINTRVEHECRMRGAERLAYPPVIAGGQRATTIHYIANNQTLSRGELLLMDAGCEYHGYVSDITRTWPVDEKFSPSQRELYEAVLDVQQTLITLCRSRFTLDQLHNKMTELLGTNFEQIGLIPKSLFGIEKSRSVSKYCPHHVSHYLGMDVHDTPTISRSCPLKPGMTITVEPGVYVSHTDQKAPKEFRGLGMRIEDNILVTENGPVVLSAKCPKTISEIESLKVQTK